MWFSKVAQWLTEFHNILQEILPILQASQVKLDPSLEFEESDRKVKEVRIKDSIELTNMILDAIVQAKVRQVWNSYKKDNSPKKRKLAIDYGDYVEKKYCSSYTEDKNILNTIKKGKIVLKLSSKTLKLSCQQNQNSNSDNCLKSTNELNKHLCLNIINSPITNFSQYSPVKSASNLCWMFRNCINFVTSCRVFPITDIDIILRNLSKIGNISNIQNHWSIGSNSRPSSWHGALVSYRTFQNCVEAYKKYYVNEYSQVIPIFVPYLLHRIAETECSWIASNPASDTETTTILIFGAHSKKTKDRITKELDKYGNIKQIQYSKSHIQVKFKYTVEAFAAALALDGKCFYRSNLCTNIVMDRKEKHIHHVLFSNFCNSDIGFICM